MTSAAITDAFSQPNVDETWTDKLMVRVKRGPAIMLAMPPQIEADPPQTWQDLEERVAVILSECGYEVEAQRSVHLARGEANVDVYAVDHTRPPNILAFECKQWRRPATRSVVHAFRTVVGDSGANSGFIVSSAGFQQGAIEAAAYSNVRLLDWRQFEELFAERWFLTYMAPRLDDEGLALHEYTESINTRIFRKADALSEERQKEFVRLRERYRSLSVANMIWGPPPLLGLLPEPPIPNLPLRNLGESGEDNEWVAHLPDDVLDAPALRPLMDALIAHYRSAIAEFDHVFGERA